MNPLELARLTSERDISRYRNKLGQRLPSVTEILALAGMIDLGGIPLELLERGSARGRIVHAITAQVDRGLPAPPNSHLLAWTHFRTETGFEPLQIEQSLISERHSFAGTLDRFGVVKEGRQVLLDIKTSVVASPWWALQLAGYQILLEDQTRETAIGPMERWSVQLRPDGDFVLRPYKSLSDRSDFLAALRIAWIHLRTRRYVLP